MKLSIRTSGGIGNIQVQGQLDTDDLPVALAGRVHEVLSPNRLGDECSKEIGLVTDSIHYEIGLYLKGGFQKFEIDDACTSHDVLEVIQELLHEIIRRKQAVK